MASSTILLKSNIIHIIMKSGYKKVGYHDAKGVFIDHKDCAFFVFKAKWTNNAAAGQVALNSYT